MPQRSALADRIKARRQVVGLSQEKLAREADVSLPTIQRLEGGRGVPKVALLSRIASALQWSLGDLFEGIDDGDAAA